MVKWRLLLVVIWCILSPMQHVTCGSIPLETSYRKISRCIYISTDIYEYRGWSGLSAKPNLMHFLWGLRNSEVRSSCLTNLNRSLLYQLKFGWNHLWGHFSIFIYSLNTFVCHENDLLYLNNWGMFFVLHKKTFKSITTPLGLIC